MLLLFKQYLKSNICTVVALLIHSDNVITAVYQIVFALRYRVQKTFKLKV